VSKIPSRRDFVAGLLAAGAACQAREAFAQSSKGPGALDVTFLFSCDIHACRMSSGLSPYCAAQGKTDANLLRHIAALNGLEHRRWPETIAGAPSDLHSAGERIARPLGLVIGGDMTDDGGGQIAMPSEGTQLLQFSHRYQQGVGPDRVHYPVYAGLGNHDLDQDGPPPHQDWYRRELRDYIELNHRPGVFFKPPVPADNFDPDSDCYSWNWGRLHLIQAHRYAGDTTRGAVSGLSWLARDLADNAAGGRPVILFQHYGWDPFSTERWDPDRKAYNVGGRGESHWWAAEHRHALLDVVADYNIIGLFHGHQHETPMIYRSHGLDIFKPKAAYLGGFALARVTDTAMDVALGEAAGEPGAVTFTHAFSKPL